MYLEFKISNCVVVRKHIVEAFISTPTLMNFFIGIWRNLSIYHHLSNVLQLRNLLNICMKFNRKGVVIVWVDTRTPLLVFFRLTPPTHSSLSWAPRGQRSAMPPGAAPPEAGPDQGPASRWTGEQPTLDETDENLDRKLCVTPSFYGPLRSFFIPP